MGFGVIRSVLYLLSLVAIAQSDPQSTICSKCACNSANKTIDCSYKKLLSLFPDDDWKALNESFETVIFAYNNINNLTKFPSLSIKKLDLSHNDIASIEPRAFHDLKLLEDLNLSNNKITSDMLKSDVFEGPYDPERYTPLKNLRVLRLSNNLLNTFYSNNFEHLSELEEFYVNDNPFKKINAAAETVFADFVKLKILDISAMELTKLPEDMFHNMQTLEYLNIARNGFHHIPEALADIQNVKELIIDENPINDLDDYNRFPDLPNLEKLSISYISMTEIFGNKAFSGLTGLKEFHAVHNYHLREIHENAFSRPGKEDETREEWPPLKKVWLHNNNISYLDSHVFANWDSFEIFDLRANSWQCDCQNKWILEEVVPKIFKNSPELVENLVCAGPKPMEKKTFKELMEHGSTMRCPDQYGNHPERDGTILIGLLLGICIGVPFTLLLVIFYKRGCFGLVRPRGPADFSRAYYKRAGVYDDTMHHI